MFYRSIGWHNQHQNLTLYCVLAYSKSIGWFEICCISTTFYNEIESLQQIHNKIKPVEFEHVIKWQSGCGS